MNWNRTGAALGLILGATSVAAQTIPPSDPPPTLQSLAGVPVPEPAALDDIVKDRQAALALGKALFWDAAVGSDGVTACASCHFHAGADHRRKNQLSPGLNNLAGEPTSVTFDDTRSGGVGGPNYRLVIGDFPFHVLADPLDRNSPILFDSDDIASSQGVLNRAFVAPGGGRMDDCTLLPDPVFSVRGHQTRRVEPRNTPTVINAAFNYRNFWDGRANHVFNGVNPFGDRDPDARVYRVDGGVLNPVRLHLERSSAASQAVGPPGSTFEMSCGGRLFPQIARRLLGARPLLRQLVAGDDSVLGPYRSAFLPLGINTIYADLVRRAFVDAWWSSPESVDLAGQRFSQMEANFSLFFGLAIQLYEASLVSDQTPLDSYLGHGSVAGDPGALSAQEKLGLAVFTGKGNCVSCHKGPELTGAATLLLEEAEEGGLVERMIMGDGGVALYDDGFYNIGVRPTVEDVGVGGRDPFGNPLSFTRQFLNVVGGGKAVDPFEVDPCSFEVGPCQAVTDPNHRAAVDGAFKVPGLRNVALTGPYFHNGSRATLAQVVEFYNRGGDRRGEDGNDTTGLAPNGSNLDADITRLDLTPDERDALVAFLEHALTDERVRWERAPFDHPGLIVPDGHLGDTSVVLFDPRTGAALDGILIVPPVGARGRAAALGPLRSFADDVAR